jgi:uncharacterized membrane protein
VLATFAGTFTYAFALLCRVEDDFVPDVGVITAGMAVAASIGLLLIYLDRVGALQAVDFAIMAGVIDMAAGVASTGSSSPRVSSRKGPNSSIRADV